jgi:multidrug efflux pump subunit AcrA (membrane-fusion protein)
MTHTTSEQSLNKSLDPSLDESTDSAAKLRRLSLPRLSRKGWGFVLGGTVLLAGGTWGLLHFTRTPQAPETAAVPAIAVNTLTVRSQPIASTLELSGTIHPVDQATLSTRVMGRITQLSLEAGDRFRKGEVLARVDVQDIAAQTNQARLGVAQAKSALAQTQAELLRSQAALNQLESQKIEAQAALQLAQIDQRRMAQLHREGAVSQERLDQANTTLSQAQAKVAQVNAGIRQAQAAIQQAQAAIGQSRAAVNQAAEGVTSASVNESYGTIVAPFDGVVVQKLAYEGEMAAPGTALLKVENPDRLQLEISVPEENLRFVHVGQPVKVQVDAVNQTLNATIQQIVPAADPNSRSFLVKIPINGSDKLISGMFGRIALPHGSQNGISIPTRALVQRGQLQGVYVVETNAANQPIAVLRWVKTGKTYNGQVEITAGITAGDRIITSNIAQLSDGQPITVNP